MKYDFDEIINRIGTNSVKYETSLNEEPNLPENYIPMWIADMEDLTQESSQTPENEDFRGMQMG